MEIETRALTAFAWLARSGVAFDRAAWDYLTQEAKRAAVELTARLDAEAPPRPGYFAGGKPWAWNSRREVKAAFEAAGIHLECTDDEALSQLAHPMAALLGDYRSAMKRVSSYADWTNHVAGDGRVYADRDLAGGNSGLARMRRIVLWTSPAPGRDRW
jgi:hypothetical protein